MQKLAQETIEALDRWSGRLEGHCTEKRANARTPCYRKIYLVVPDEYVDAIAVGDEGMAEGITRNISTSGVGFILQQHLPAESLTVCFRQDTGEWLRIAGKVVRHRQVHNGYWEYGVRFIRSVENE